MARIHVGSYDDRDIDGNIGQADGCLIIGVKGVYDTIDCNGSAAISMSDKRSAVEGLALRESLGRTRTQLRWCRSEAHVSDGLTKAGPRALLLLRKLLSTNIWRISWGPSVTSSKKLRSQAKAKGAPRRPVSARPEKAE